MSTRPLDLPVYNSTPISLDNMSAQIYDMLYVHILAECTSTIPHAFVMIWLIAFRTARARSNISKVSQIICNEIVPSERRGLQPYEQAQVLLPRNVMRQVS